MFKWFKRKGKNVNKVNYTTNTVYLDYGNNTIKAIADGKPLIIKSCIRKVINNYVTRQLNAVMVNGEHFIIGESNGDYNNADKKINRDYTKEMILYIVDNLNKNFKPSADGVIDVNLHMLLPYSELGTGEEFKSLLSGLNLVTRLDGLEFKYRINLVRCYAEGEMASYHLNLDGGREDKVILDIGGGTTEWFVYDKYFNLINKLSTREGLRNLMTRYIENLSYKNSSVLNRLFSQNYPFSSEEWKIINDTNMQFIKSSMSDGKNLILDYLNPYATEIICIGGGSKVLENSLKVYFSKQHFKLTFLKDDEVILANLLGLKKFVEDNKDNAGVIVQEDKEIENNNDIPFVEEIKEKEIISIPKVIKPRSKPANNTDVDNRRLSVKELSKLGVSIKEISNQLGISEQTVKNDRRYLTGKGEI